MKIVFITTVASSIYGFRAPVIKKLIGKNHQVYAFVSEFSDNELDIIREMGGYTRYLPVKPQRGKPVFRYKIHLPHI